MKHNAIDGVDVVSASIWNDYHKIMGDVNFGGYNIDNVNTVNAHTFESDIAIGTAPFTVVSTTKVDNLNVDQVDGYDMDQALLQASSPTFAYVFLSNTPTLPSHATHKEYVDSVAQGIAWQDPVLDQIDMTSAEPVAPSDGDRYINTGTGNSSETAQAVVANRIYEWNTVDWDEYIPVEGWAVWDQDADMNYVYNGSAWVTFGSTVTHNNLAGLQGGTTDEYYHFTSARHAVLAGIADLTSTDSYFIVGSAGGWVAETGDTARISLGLGTTDSPTFANITDSGLTASRIVASDGAKKLSSVDLSSWVDGTATKVTVTDDADGTITLTIPDSVTLVNLTTTDITIGANTIDTNEWAFLDGLNQSLATGSSATFANVTDSALTAGRVVIAGAAGLLADDSDFTFDIATLTVTNIAAFNLTGKLTAGATEIEGSAFDINGGTVDGITSLTVANAVDIGAFGLTALTFTSDQATGTAPFTVASTTKVTNLNADTVDGYDTGSLGGAGAISVTASRYALGGATTVSHSTADGYIHLPSGGASNQLLKNSGTAGTASWGTATENAGALAAVTTIGMSGQLTNTLAIGTAPFVVTSTTVVANLNVSKATLASTVTVADTAETSTYVALFEGDTGSLAAKTDAGLTYNASTGILTATGFSGPLTGAASTIVVIDESSDTSNYVAFFNDATGSLAIKTGTNLTFNSSTGVLTATGLNVGDIIPSAADTYDLGSTTVEWKNLYIGTGKVYFYTDQQEWIASSGAALYFATGGADELILNTTTFYPAVNLGNSLGSVSFKWQDLHVDDLYVYGSTTHVGDLVVTGNILPGTADTYTLGNATYEWEKLYLGDSSVALQFGITQDRTIGWDGTDLVISGSTSINGYLAISDISIPDDDATALVIAEGANAYMTFDTTDDNEKIIAAEDVDMSNNNIRRAQSVDTKELKRTVYSEYKGSVITAVNDWDLR